jgi:hypothetical protein
MPAVTATFLPVFQSSRWTNLSHLQTNQGICAAGSNTAKVLLKESIHVVLGTSRNELSMDHRQPHEPALSRSPDGKGEPFIPSRLPFGFLIAMAGMWLVVVASALGFMDCEQGGEACNR